MERILAIDDNRDNLISLKAITRDAFPDATIDLALNGLTGIDLAIAQDPDVILLDILMPDMDGFEVCRRLKRDDRLRDIPVVFLTAIKQSKESRIEALEIGAEAFLSKPIDVPELTAQIRAMIKIKAAKKQIRDEKTRLSSLVAERTSELERSHIEMIKLLDELKVENEVRKRTEKDLLLEKTFTEAIFNSVPGLIYLYDEEGNLIRWNKNHELMTGYSYQELSRMRLMDWCKGDRATKDAFSKRVKAFMKKGFVEAEVDMQKKDHTTVPMYLTACPLSIGGKQYFTGIGLDMTERKQKEGQIKTLGRAIEQGPSSIVITNKKGEIEFVNNKFTSLTQYHLEDVKGRKPRVFNPGHLPEKEFDTLWDTLQKGTIWKGEVQNRRKDKTLFWEETIISVLMSKDHTISNYILIMNDITEKKQILDDLIAAKEKAEESDRLKSAFLANMSHEIRTPLNSIIGFSDLMLEPDFDMTKHAEYTGIINVNGINMLTTISDILDLSKIEAGLMSIKKDIFSVNEMVEKVYTECAYKANKKGIELRLDSLSLQQERTINSDANKLKHILLNLVCNATKFSKEGIIEIGFKSNGDFILFHVRDTGIGIPKEFHDKIFDRFSQVESDYTKEYGGNGLGLAISKSFVELLGGKIWLESELGKGSTFYFTIPE